MTLRSERLVPVYVPEYLVPLVYAFIGEHANGVASPKPRADDDVDEPWPEGSKVSLRSEWLEQSIRTAVRDSNETLRRCLAYLSDEKNAGRGHVTADVLRATSLDYHKLRAALAGLTRRCKYRHGTNTWFFDVRWRREGYVQGE